MPLLHCVFLCEELAFRRKAFYFLDKVSAGRFVPPSWRVWRGRSTSGPSATRCIASCSTCCATRSSSRFFSRQTGPPRLHRAPRAQRGPLERLCEQRLVVGAGGGAAAEYGGVRASARLHRAARRASPAAARLLHQRPRRRRHARRADAAGGAARHFRGDRGVSCRGGGEGGNRAPRRCR